ncbi:MAG: tetratricopeptide repeat protein, partial [Bacteroidetes bacterium]|nr:tetratricopeptide repeat protein [Bacteroidota bacterium]
MKINLIFKTILQFHLIFFVGFFFVRELPAQEISPVSENIENALVNDGWEEVLNLLNFVKVQSSSSVLKIIKGHSCLALNRNNESLCLFSSVSLESDFKKWDEWTERFLIQYFDSPISYYFRGDAFARLGQWDNAIEKFNKALEIQPDYALALNARGVCNSAKNMLNKALVDFFMATKIDSMFADAYANQGALSIQKREGANGALKAFNKALKISHNFILALNGRASISIVIDKWNQAESDLEQIYKTRTECLSKIIEYLAMNAHIFLYANSEAISETINKLAKIKPGMSQETISQKIAELSPQDKALVLGSLENALRWNSSTLPLIPDMANINIYAKGKGFLVGNVPIGYGEVGAKVDISWNLSENALENMRFQEDVHRELCTRFPEIKPVKLNIFESFILSQTKFRELTQPGGVSTQEIEQARTDKGNWNVVTLYGLLYRIMS